MTNLAKQLDQTLNTIVLKSENHLELLMGDCQSDVALTNTQEHILMLVMEGRVNNSDLAKALKVSQAAITKAVRPLKNQGLLEAVKDEQDGRITYYRLTNQAQPIADEHLHHHQQTLQVYDNLLKQYSQTEQAVISRFLGDLLQTLKGEL